MSQSKLTNKFVLLGLFTSNHLKEPLRQQWFFCARDLLFDNLD
ncbi:hypothetical protein PPEP_a4585 [Pseudoalteromonas peptidolytica F12-50-A1]|uniref:Uncharacterized protein n=1 Tax=Pseudoalteromonas peptidolytica F12-50-A1 TaxID=1315280 RepID=A0A8I0MZW8_9GAMM|nr:hypothetical protein [Pseudoalteromonas peptidolytica F12-50-A1]